MYSKRVGVLGGTFDPIHRGHIDVAERVKTKMFLDEVWLVPNNIPPHRPQPGASAADRLKMCNLATRDSDYIKTSDIEARTQQPSFAVNSMGKLQERYPEYKFFYVIGVDAACDLMTWKEPLELVQKCDFIVVTRPGYEVGQIWSYIHETPLSQHAAKFHVIKIPTTDISSTRLRDMVRKGEDVTPYVGEDVVQYIKGHSLYR